MKTIFKVALVLTVFGAINSVIYGMSGNDLIAMITKPERTVGGDFLRILIAISAIATLVLGMKAHLPNKNN